MSQGEASATAMRETMYERDSVKCARETAFTFHIVATNDEAEKKSVPCADMARVQENGAQNKRERASWSNPVALYQKQWEK